MNDEQPRVAGRGAPFRAHPPRLLGRLLAFASGAVLLVVAFMASLLLFAILLTGGFLVGGYLWWKTRDLRRRMREQARAQRSGGRVVEGEVIRDLDADDSARR
jgi:hypothetical protein